jgi:glutamate-1-semialdehyde 2,1-aminomutase
MTSQSKQFSQSARLFSESQKYLAGGVSSGMRAAAKPLPLFFSSAAGSQLIDVDGNQYVDYTLAWGPLILGHSHPGIVAAVSAQLKACQLLGAQHELEIEVARKICKLVASAERVIFSNSGTEAIQVALRLARTYTGRRKIIRFEGHYHGWMENILPGYRPSADSPLGRASGSRSPGAAETLVLPWNDLGAVERALQAEGQDVAALMTEPILCNSHSLMPELGYLEGLRELTRRYGVVLIFDEVITGFRVVLGGAQALFGVTPDLTTMGKAVGGGFPLSAVGGPEEIMQLVAQQKVPHAGTFNGNPISLAAARATLETLEAEQGALLEQVRRNGERLIQGIEKSAAAAGIPILINGVGSCFHVAFTTRQTMRNYRDTLDSDISARDQFLLAMLADGVYLMPDGRWYVSTAHTKQDITRTLEIVEQVFAKFKAKLLPAHSRDSARV